MRPREDVLYVFILPRCAAVKIGTTGEQQPRFAGGARTGTNTRMPQLGKPELHVFEGKIGGRRLRVKILEGPRRVGSAVLVAV